mmetsp:Transcript_5231/g.16807  ORF Transcript_5231/g.16807 Transcript_5231/m.16807 type:complete len:925 (-) Transcript_5231:2642-5416(-)
MTLLLINHCLSSSVCSEVLRLAVFLVLFLHSVVGQDFSCLPVRIVSGVGYPYDHTLNGMFSRIYANYRNMPLETLTQNAVNVGYSAALNRQLYYTETPWDRIHNEKTCPYMWHVTPWKSDQEPEMDSTTFVTVYSNFNVPGAPIATKIDYGQVFLPTNATTRAGLLSLYNATNGPLWTQATGWNTTNNQTGPLPDYCAWYGVECRGADVVAVRLPNNNLAGSLPRAFFYYLWALRDLDLSGNALTGAVPRDIELCTKLEHVDFSRNSLYLAVPDLSASARLSSLRAARNRFSGAPPLTALAAGAAAASVTVLDLSDNDLAGTVDGPSLAALTALEELHLGGNSLRGTLPGLLPPHLLTLNLSSNLFAGPIPAAWFNDISLSPPFLTRLDLTANLLSGSLPVNIGRILRGQGAGRPACQAYPEPRGSCRPAGRSYLSVAGNFLTGAAVPALSSAIEPALPVYTQSAFVDLTDNSFTDCANVTAFLGSIAKIRCTNSTMRIFPANVFLTRQTRTESIFPPLSDRPGPLGGMLSVQAERICLSTPCGALTANVTANLVTPLGDSPYLSTWTVLNWAANEQAVKVGYLSIKPATIQYKDYFTTPVPTLGSNRPRMCEILLNSTDFVASGPNLTFVSNVTAPLKRTLMFEWTLAATSGDWCHSMKLVPVGGNLSSTIWPTGGSASTSCGSCPVWSGTSASIPLQTTLCSVFNIPFTPDQGLVEYRLYRGGCGNGNQVMRLPLVASSSTQCSSDFALTALRARFSAVAVVVSLSRCSGTGTIYSSVFQPSKVLVDTCTSAPAQKWTLGFSLSGDGAGAYVMPRRDTATVNLEGCSAPSAGVRYSVALFNTTSPSNSSSAKNASSAGNTSSAGNASANLTWFGWADSVSVSCTAVGYCGDGVRDGSREDCDDGNTFSLDGCDNLCRVEVPA